MPRSNKWQRGDVVAERPREVPVNGAQGAPGELDRSGHDVQVIAHQDQVGGAERDVGAVSTA
jgi:hypothetical protein